MSNLSNAEIAAIIWNKTNKVPFSELSDAHRTELEIQVSEGGGAGEFGAALADYVIVATESEANTVTPDPWKGKKLVDKLKKGKK